MSLWSHRHVHLWVVRTSSRLPGPPSRMYSDRRLINVMARTHNSAYSLHMRQWLPGVLSLIPAPRPLLSS